MEFEIESKFDVGADVITKNNHCAKIVDIKMRQVGKVVNIEYLLEFEDGERHWQDEETLDKEVSLWGYLNSLNGRK